MTVEEVVPPQHGACASPAPLTLASGKVSTNGSTTLALNEFGTSIACGTAYDFDGPQVYYKVPLLAGKHYTVTVTATASAFDTALYAFSASTPCNVTAINTPGRLRRRALRFPRQRRLQRHVASLVGASRSFSCAALPMASLTPVVAGDWINAVDGWTSDESGPFDLTILQSP